MIPTKKNLTVAKAAPLGDRIMPSAILNIIADLPEVGHDPDWRERAAALYDADAAQVFEALKCLPGGTFDRVLIKMLESTATLLKVGHSIKVGE